MESSLRLADSEDTGRLSDSVYETLLAAILAGQLLPGSVVSEVALARQLNVSRTPVHDALRQLAKDGLLKQRANHRAVVAQFSREDVFDIFEMRNSSKERRHDWPLLTLTGRRWAISAAWLTC